MRNHAQNCEYFPIPCTHKTCDEKVFRKEWKQHFDDIQLHYQNLENKFGILLQKYQDSEREVSRCHDEIDKGNAHLKEYERVSILAIETSLMIRQRAMSRRRHRFGLIEAIIL